MSYDVEGVEGKAEGERAAAENLTTQDVSRDVTKGAAASPKSTDTQPIVSATPAYFTDGEMLPWKGRWFRVKLLELDGQKIIGLVSVKDTASAIKRAVRTQRWQRQHPRAVVAKDGSRLHSTSPDSYKALA